ncbi:hypothetical protein DFH28DRAFT_958515 [Melampsora americana]|nr:hypothetical protein DFH28DRAFT_958515 [Melampsora americana]
MKPIAYIFFLAAHFSLYGHVMSQSKRFLCDKPGPNIASFGVCAPDNQKPRPNELFIANLTDALAGKRLATNKFGKYGEWTCRGRASKVSYCCKFAVDATKNTAKECRRQK